MLLTVHALTGAALGVASGNPLVAAPLGFTSHFVCDSTPHFGSVDFRKPQGFRVGVLDCMGALSVYLLLIHWLPQFFWPITVGVFFACLPDLFYLPEIFFHRQIMPRLRRFHGRIQWHESLPAILTDVTWGTLMILVLHKLAG